MKRIALVTFLLLMTALPVSAQEDDAPIVLEPGVYLEGGIDPQTLTADVYFDGVAEDVVSIVVNSSVRSGYFDLDEVIIFLPDGTEMVRRPIAYFAEVHFSLYRLPQTGRYHIAIMGHTAGRYGVRYTVRATPTFDDTYYHEESFNSATAGYLDFTFTASAGDTIQSYVITGWFDAVLTLYDPAGSVLATDDDSLRDLNPSIGPITLEQGGEYRLVVESYNSNEEGKFYIYLIRDPHPAENEIAYGQLISVTLDSERSDYRFRLDGSNGDVVSLLIDDPDEIAHVQLNRDTDYRRVMVSTDDTVTSLYDNWGEFVLPADDCYWLVITARDETVSGTVQVRLNLTGENSLDGFSQGASVHISQKDPIKRFFFTGYDSHGVARISITQADYEAETMPYRVTVYDEAGHILGQMVIDDLVGSFSLSNEFGVGVVNGQMTIEIEMLGEGPAWFQLSLEVVYGMG